MPDSLRSDRDSIEYDAVIVGAGPAGLACAIRLKQIDPEINVCILEKGSEVGAHILSGAVLEMRAFEELFPDWRNMDGVPLHTQATWDRFLFLTEKTAIKLPLPPQMRNHGNYIISLGNLTRWMAMQAEALGVEIFPGFAAAELLCNEEGAVIGVATGDMGLDSQGNKTDGFEPGMEIHARQTILAEGCHGSLTKIAAKRYDLRAASDPQTYGLGIKELWEIEPGKHTPGSVIHTIGWPMDRKTYGGSWIYHLEDNLVSIGFVVGLDYQNPYLSPYEEMQRFKTHPAIRPLLEGGRRVAYGARALSEGGLQSIPKLAFPGGLLIGDSAGFLNVPKIKGNHTAMKSGMVAAETLAAWLAANKDVWGVECGAYPDAIRQSWIWSELKKVRNIRPGFHKGLWVGLLNAVFETLTGGLAPWTLKNHADHAQLQKAAQAQKISYPKPDGMITFDRLTSVSFSGTNHAENQPCHLQLVDPSVPVAVNLKEYDEPAQRYCPAGVYEIVKDEAGQSRLQINAQNCVHCKTCDIKDPSQNINWVPPQGGDGPNYPNM
ncbi:MAG: electron transfer flavoprotein-ubiquinone oxidoreductase [Alphaproteobacteria bacterium]|nr:electron transfer flavoprotein-ubiquinone oxidoreductase [Alphaproteobacteria bacterium]